MNITNVEDITLKFLFFMVANPITAPIANLIAVPILKGIKYYHSKRAEYYDRKAKEIGEGSLKDLYEEQLKKIANKTINISEAWVTVTESDSVEMAQNNHPEILKKYFSEYEYLSNEGGMAEYRNYITKGENSSQKDRRIRFQTESIKAYVKDRLKIEEFLSSENLEWLKHELKRIEHTEKLADCAKKAEILAYGIIPIIGWIVVLAKWSQEFPNPDQIKGYEIEDLDKREKMEFYREKNHPENPKHTQIHYTSRAILRHNIKILEEKLQKPTNAS